MYDRLSYPRFCHESHVSIFFSIAVTCHRFRNREPLPRREQRCEQRRFGRNFVEKIAFPVDEKIFGNTYRLPRERGAIGRDRRWERNRERVRRKGEIYTYSRRARALERHGQPKLNEPTRDPKLANFLKSHNTDWIATAIDHDRRTSRRPTCHSASRARPT